MVIKPLEGSNNAMLVSLTELAESKTNTKILSPSALIPAAVSAPDIGGQGVLDQEASPFIDFLQANKSEKV